MKKITLNLSGKNVVLGPLLAAVIRDNKEQIRAVRENKLQPDELVGLTCKLVLACCQRVDPGVTLEQVEDLVDVENVGEAFQACWGVSVPPVEPGETGAAVSTLT